MSARGIQLVALSGIPEVRPGDDLAGLILTALSAAAESLRDGDVVVVAQKVVSKSEGRYVALAEVTPSAAAVELATAAEKDPRLVQLILDNAREVLRVRPGLIIVEHTQGMVMANAGIDQSNLEAKDGERVLLLPEDADASCAALRARLRKFSGADVAVVINDTWGRAWRRGLVGQALGVSGLAAVRDLRGRPDRAGRPLAATEIALADEIAAAASLLQGHADEGTPVVLLRGLELSGEPTDARAGRDLIRERELDLFR